MTDIQRQQLYSIFRNLMAAGLGWAIGKGYVGTEVGAQLLALLALLGPIAWEYFERRFLIRDAVNTGIVVANSTVGPAPLMTEKGAAAAIVVVTPTLPTVEGKTT